MTKGNWIVATGINSVKTHPLQAHYNKTHRTFVKLPCRHAEIDALINSGREDLSGSEIFVYREDRNGEQAICKPCPSCVAALRDAGVTTVYYSENSHDSL